MTENLDTQELSSIVEKTVEDYANKAESFWEGTRDHDVSMNRNALLRSLEGEAPHKILDFGCGPGRDLAIFKDLGHHVTGLDACPQFCEMAREWSKCEVWNQNFLSLELPDRHFDGIFANASLFHVPAQELPRVLQELHNALKQGGVLISSNPRGDNEEGWSGNRYGSFHTPKAWCQQLIAIGFEEIEQYYRPPGRPRDLQPWFVSLWRKNKL